MSKKSKKYVAAEAQIPAEPVSPLAAMALLKEISTANFDETVTGDFRLGIDTRQADQQLRGTVSLPNGSGKTVRVAVFAEGEAARAAEEAGADIVGHNIETTERLTPQVRSRARYDVSIKVLRYLADRGQRVKSGLMVGLGESDDEVIKTLGDLRSAGCSIVTIGQYLQPTLKHHKLERYVHPDTFSRYKSEAERMGFDFVASAPMVRSSYMAEQALMKDKSE